MMAMLVILTDFDVTFWLSIWGGVNCKLYSWGVGWKMMDFGRLQDGGVSRSGVTDHRDIHMALSTDQRFETCSLRRMKK